MTVIRVGLSLRTDVFAPTEVNYEEGFRPLSWNTQVHNLRPVMFTFVGYISQRITTLKYCHLPPRLLNT